MKEIITTSLHSENNITVVCTACCKLISVSSTWKKGSANSNQDDAVILDHAICPECQLDSLPNEYTARQNESNSLIEKSFKIESRLLSDP